MKKICKVILAAAAITALAAPAMAADKLIVKNAGGTADVFKVDDNGSISAGFFSTDAVTKKLGSGLTTGHAPEASFHVVDNTSSAARGVIVGQHNTGNQAANVIFRKSRGTDVAPTAVLLGDYIAAFHGNAYNGTAFVTTATVNYLIDATPSSTVMPQAILLSTGVNSNGAADPGNKFERVRVSSAGNVILGARGGAAIANIDPAATNGHVYLPIVSGAVTSCATMTTYVGHAPVWVDSTNFKVCSCISGALKCTAVMD